MNIKPDVKDSITEALNTIPFFDLFCIADTRTAHWIPSQVRYQELGKQAHRRGTEGESSTGLELAVCRDFIEKHRGKVREESSEMKEDISCSLFNPSTY